MSVLTKTKVPIGEPGFAVSTGVPGNKTIASTDTTLVAADHDMTKVSVIPYVNLYVKVPEDRRIFCERQGKCVSK